MAKYDILKNGDVSDNGQISIVDQDKLCYKVKSMSRGSVGIRTISKDLLDEYVLFFSEKTDANANEARDTLSGNSDIDKFEYGYSSTLTVMAKMILANKDFNIQNQSTNTSILNPTLQQIFYGAPGTGKSFTINHDTKGEDVIRTTFHPDSDYSSFVGAYKPTTIEEPVMTVIDTKLVPVENAKPEKKIIYEFVSQAFLQAYVKAWTKYAEAGSNTPKKQFLIIEEINRGNCAQIFGDLFQLLDRNDKGFSDYPITADADMKKQLERAFSGKVIANKKAINALYDGRDVVSEVLNGDILLLPNNLYIWATMNTSDQSLFPIDSAFKRRWDWKYIPINTRKEQWFIDANNAKYSWSDFLEKINDIINDKTSSEDKQLGFYFCKAKDNIIDAETFVSKVVFYLWNDVFKDYGFEGEYFSDPDGGILEFRKFYNLDGSINGKKVEALMKNLKIEANDENNGDADNQDKGVMKVSFPDGTIVEGKTTVDVFMKTIDKIVNEHGIDEVKNADIKFSGLNIIQDEGWQTDKFVKSTQKQMEGYVLFLNADNAEKKRGLDRLSKKLTLGLTVEFVS